jgi:2-dehydro-3-deoxyphosphooctonate aldolase (KDO 8-P synthase)
MGFAVEKVLHENPNAQVFLTDRGNSFGYGDLVVDYRNILKCKLMVFLW